MKELSAKEVEEKIVRGEDIHIIDVREKEEVDEGKIPEAKHIPLGELEDRVVELDKYNEYIIVCRSGSRSLLGVNILIKNGFKAINMKGGMNDWNGELTFSL